MSEQSSIDSEINYEVHFLRKIRWILFFLLFFIFLILSKIPIVKSLDNVIYNSLSFGACQINISNYEIKVFPLPHLDFQNITVPDRCFSPGAGDINLKDLQVYFRGPSFSPFGPQFKVETEFENNPLSLYLSSNFTFEHIKVLMQENSIELAKFSKLIPKVNLSGDIKTDMLIEMKKFKLSKLNLNLQSNSLLFPAQSISGFALQEMPLKNLLLTANSDNGKTLTVKKLVIGDEKAPIRCEFSGKIDLNNRNFMASNLNLAGQIAFSEQFMSDPSMGLVQGYMSQFDKKDNFYQILIKGALSFPLISSNR